MNRLPAMVTLASVTILTAALCVPSGHAQVSPSTMNGLLDSADTALRSGEFEKTVSLCTSALQLDSTSQVAYWLRSLAFGEQKLYVAAVEDLKKVNALASDSPEPYVRRALYLMLLGKMNEARALLEDRTQEDQLDPNAEGLLGHCYVLDGDTTTGKVHYRSMFLCLRSMGDLVSGPLTTLGQLKAIGRNVPLLETEDQWLRETLGGIVSLVGERSLPLSYQVLTMTAEAINAKKQHAFPEAESLYIAVSELVASVCGRDHPRYASSLNNLATLYAERSDPIRAEQLLRKALQILEAQLVRNMTSVARTTGTLGAVYRQQNRLDEAEVYFGKSLALLEQGGKDWDVASVNNSLGLLYMSRGQFAKAQPFLEKAISLFERSGPLFTRALSNLYGNLASSCEELGQAGKAEMLFEKALSLMNNDPMAPLPDRARVAIGLASLYSDRGDLDAAEQKMKEALALADALPQVDDPIAATVRNNYAVLCRKEGRLHEAEVMYRNSLEIRQKTLPANHPLIAQSLSNLGSLLLSRHELRGADSLYRAALTIAESWPPNTNSDIPEMMSNLAITCQGLGRFAEAESLYLKSLECDKGYPTPNMDRCAIELYNLAIFYQERNRIVEEERTLKDALGLLNSASNANAALRWPIVASLSWVCALQGRCSESGPLVEQALDDLHSTIARTNVGMSEREKTAYHSTFAPAFQMLPSLAMRCRNEKSGLVGSALNSQLYSKAFLFEATRRVHRNIRRSGDSALVAEYDKWLQARKTLGKISLVGRATAASWGLDVDSLTALANEMEKDLSRRSEAFKNAYEQKPVTWKQVRSVLSEGEAGIEIVRFLRYNLRWTDTVCYAALIVTTETKEQPELVLLENGNQLENECFKLYRSVMAIGRDTMMRGARPEEVESLPVDEARVYEAYWQHIHPALEGIKRVYLSADGVYNKINVETLRMPDRKYVGEVMEIRSVTSLRDLVAGRPETNSRNSAELFGYPKYDLGAKEQLQLAANLPIESVPRTRASVDRRVIRGETVKPLPGTEEEAVRVDSLLKGSGWRTRLHLREDALEEEVKSVESPRVLHIATHGFFQPNEEKTQGSSLQITAGEQVQNPLLRSGLLLAGAERTLNRKEGEEPSPDVDDGILTAYEAMNLNLDQTELVVLSACETGLGDILSGEGVYGLQRAFQVAGARYVMMSLWKVDDAATQELMTSFYREWLRSGDVRMGFKEAQSQIREKYRNPFYWGAFVLVGI
jgi:CHAT domain-containing protein/tetratricopeptide (TPR) repeat protein